MAKYCISCEEAPSAMPSLNPKIGRLRYHELKFIRSRRVRQAWNSFIQKAEHLKYIITNSYFVPTTANYPGTSCLTFPSLWDVTLQMIVPP